jgi:hypothetical protein
VNIFLSAAKIGGATPAKAITELNLRNERLSRLL